MAAPAKKAKKYHRIRAHRNPLSDWGTDYPASPQQMDWSQHFPHYDEKKAMVEFADIGCGYGGLTVALAKMFPDKLTVGMEIRPKVVEYVKQRIEKLRARAAEQGSTEYSNCSVILTNAMKFLVNYFRKGQLSKLFFLFPDPHFKKSTHRRRIVSTNLLSEYAYVLRPGGLLYTATDVRDLHDWMSSQLESHPLFERIPAADAACDPCVPLILHATEEANKVMRAAGDKYYNVFRRRATAFSLPLDVRMPTPAPGAVEEFAAMVAKRQEEAAAAAAAARVGPKEDAHDDGSDASGDSDDSMSDADADGMQD